ncbi:MAG TPA: hypothetical protein VI756_10610 [Blastocatellia bacterium]
MGETEIADELSLASPLLLVSCIDYRFVVPTASYMAGRGFTFKYYHIGVAGASLGSNRYPKFFEGHLQLLKDSGVNPEMIIVMDHLDCAAYKKWNGGDDSISGHAEQLCILRSTISRFYGADKPVETLIMSREGVVDPVYCK